MMNEKRKSWWIGFNEIKQNKQLKAAVPYHVIDWKIDFQCRMEKYFTKIVSCLMHFNELTEEISVKFTDK